MAKGAGLRDWKIQRITAILMVIYTFFFVGYWWMQPTLSYDTWKLFFSMPFMRITTPLIVAAIAWHAWIGMWTVSTDYIPGFKWRLLFNTVVVVTLLGFFLWNALLVGSLA